MLILLIDIFGLIEIASYGISNKEQKGEYQNS